MCCTYIIFSKYYLYFRVALWSGRSSHPVRRGPDVSGAGELEAPEHPAALQGERAHFTKTLKVIKGPAV